VSLVPSLEILMLVIVEGGNLGSGLPSVLGSGFALGGSVVDWDGFAEAYVVVDVEAAQTVIVGAAVDAHDQVYCSVGPWSMGICGEVFQLGELAWHAVAVAVAADACSASLEHSY
jgi:hypothetical protein